MPKMFLPAGKMNLDKGPVDGDHLWVAKDVLMLDVGYEEFPVPEVDTSITVTSGDYPQGAIGWIGGGSGRVYYSTSSSIFEVALGVATDVSRSSGGAYTNATNGSSFASYGKKCYHSNGVNKINSIIVPESVAQSDNFVDITYTTDGAVIAPKYICSHKNHLIGANIKMLAGYGQIGTASTTGIATPFTQPASVGLEVVSSSAADGAAFTATIYGCKGSDTIVSATVTLNGLTAVTTAAPHTWTKVLGVAKSAVTTGTITFQVAGGGAAVTTLAPGAVSGGFYSLPTALSAGESYVDLVLDTAGTYQIGVYGTNENSLDIIDSQAMSGTTTVQSNLKFKTVTQLLIGDLPLASTVTITSYQFATTETYPHLLWISGTDLPEGYGDPQVAPQIVGSDYRYLFDGSGVITGIIDGGDCFFVFKSGSIYRFDGPPFQPTIISYTVGMEAGLVPYRQGNRVYFLADAGLSYIDINTNEIVNVFKDVMQRSVIDFTNINFGFSAGCFPAPNVSSVQAVAAGYTTPKASISGDSNYGLVFMVYGNASLPYGPNAVQIICYNSNNDSFSLISGPAGTSGVAPIAVEVSRSQANGKYPASTLKVLQIYSATVHRMYKWSLNGLSAVVSGAEPYIRYPFKGIDPEKGRTRISRVRPVFDNAVLSDFTPVFNGIKVEIISISGVGKSWKTNGVFSTGLSTYSKDGWIDVSDCKFADKHSIGVKIDGTATDTAGIFVRSLIGIEIEYVINPSRAV